MQFDAASSLPPVVALGNVRASVLYVLAQFIRMFPQDDSDIRYIEMRDKQAEILSEIYRNVSELKTTPDTAKIISDFLVKIAQEYDRENDVSDLLEECESINEGFKERSLPQTREEFEDRARLFVVMRSIEDFLEIKKERYN